ncbi:hypothetical protein M409DRAFT_17353 [Zasmidium cellare ATCC 36951]|uniref:C2H2-type domain-containing protein n=1 Tax=Zasmidium cellare ATCC 36951 TaxID=1080233 RepID=A0A6A6CZE5_ZASCE|nr:uncharacterized protein M409DRAFT_17353 [Zasmidium cellare ATCC 36951]KAF2172113.1 hypothetical protein M409DRAFT_17353 [Zasmidium cellare ATCC 36951]
MEDTIDLQLDLGTDAFEAQTHWNDLVELPSDGYLDDLPLFPELENILQADESCELSDTTAPAIFQDEKAQLLEGSPEPSHRGPKRSTGNRDLHSQLCAAENESLPPVETIPVDSGGSSIILSRTTSLNQDNTPSTLGPTPSMPPSPCLAPLPHGHHTLSHQASDSSMHSMDSAVSVSSKRGLRIVRGYRCDECAATFDVPSELRHHQRKHISKDDRPYACSVCTVRFLYPKDLVRHMRRKHGMPHDSQQDLNGRECGTVTSNNANQFTTPDEAIDHSASQAFDAGSTFEVSPHISESNETLVMKLKAARDDAGLWLAERNYFAELVSNDHQRQPPLLYFKYDEMGRTSPKQRAKGWLLGIKALLKIEKNEHALDDPDRTAEALDYLLNDLENLALIEGDQ